MLSMILSNIYFGGVVGAFMASKQKRVFYRLLDALIWPIFLGYLIGKITIEVTKDDP